MPQDSIKVDSKSVGGRHKNGRKEGQKELATAKMIYYIDKIVE